MAHSTKLTSNVLRSLLNLNKQATSQLSQRLLLSTTSSCSTDPVQQLFLDKLAEYKDMQAASGTDGLVGSTPETEADVAAQVDGLAKRFGAASAAEMETFPEFSFEK